MIRKRSFIALAVASLCAAFAPPVAHAASLVGTFVTGSLTFSGDPSNYFDPGYGFVPAMGYLNSSGATVTISDSAVEFGYDDGASVISANFSDNALSVSDLIELSGASSGFRLTFTDAAFAGQVVSGVSDDFPFTSYAVSGDVLTLNYAGAANPPVGQTLAASFTLTAAPEPSSKGLIAGALLTALSAFYRKQLRA